MLDKVIGWAKKLTEAGVAVIALAVVVQIIFGGDAAFLPCLLYTSPSPRA